MNKFAQTVEMSLDITESEKKEAKTLVDLLKLMVRRLNNFNLYLDHLYNPLKAAQSVSDESVQKYRGTLWRYTEEIEREFGVGADNSKKISQWSIKKLALVSATKLKLFSSDTEFSKLFKSFSDDITNVEKNVENLVKAIRNIDNSTFKDNVVKAMENLKKELSELIKIIEERIIDHVNTNILAINWVEDSGKEFNIKVEDKEPYIVRLYKERMDRARGN